MMATEKDDESLLERLRSRGEEVLTQVSGELMANPRFVRAMQGAIRGKEKVEEAAARAIKTMNIPTRTEFRKALSRIESLERELAAVRQAAAGGRRRTAAKGGGVVRKARGSSSSGRRKSR